MKTEIEIVTAFFSINRESWKGFQRSDELYFEYFKGWAKLKNTIVVYTEKEELKKSIIAFRASLGLEDKTRVVVLSDITKIDLALYQEMQSVASNSVHKQYRLFPGHPEVWNANYDYVMLLKMWCCADAVQKGYVRGMIAWMDFGYNHGGAVLDAASDFNYLWTYDFPDAINVFLVQDLDSRPIFDVVFSMDTYIMGMMIVAPAHLWGGFWELMKKNMRVLLQAGIIDDDQNVILMCLRERPELFHAYKSSWQLPLKEFGGEHLLLASAYNQSHNKTIYKILKKVVGFVRHRYLCAKYAFRLYNHYKNVIIH